MGNFLVDEDGKVKVFGFRSGKLYKMIIAFLYYVACAYIIVTSIINEFKYYSFEPIDIVLVVIKYIFIIIFLFSPLIFLSDFKYVYNIPLFKKKEKASSAIGIIIVLAICYFMMQLNIYVGSNLYKNSVKEYTLRNTTQTVAPSDKEIQSDELKVILGNLQVAKGYKVQVATDDKFGKNALLVDKVEKKNEFTIKDGKLKNQKTLYVRAKSFGTIKKKDKNDKWAKITVEGDWSDVKKVKVVTPKKKTTEVKTTEKQTDKKQKETKKKDKKEKETKKQDKKVKETKKK